MKGLILVVDDDFATRDSLADIIRLEGFEVDTVANGEDALQLLENQRYDVILLDILMTGMDGMEVLHKIAEREADLAALPGVIMLTGHGSMQSAIDALRYGADDYLLKPSTSEEIIASVNRSISRQSELAHRRRLLDQMQASIQQLRTVEGMSAPVPIVRTGPFTLAGDIRVDLERRVIYAQSVGEQGRAGIAPGLESPQGMGEEEEQGSLLRVQLTPTEGKLMKVFLEQPGHLFTHKQLVLLVQGYHATDWEAPEIMRPLVSRLRRKLAAFPGGVHWISNVRGTGYLFET